MTRRRCREQRGPSLSRRALYRGPVACSAARKRTPRPPCEPGRRFASLQRRKIFLFDQKHTLKPYFVLNILIQLACTLSVDLAYSALTI